MNESQLQIVISVINDAADQLSQVGSQLSELADQTAATASEMSESMTAASSAIDDSLDATNQALAEAAVATATQWEDAGSEITDTMATVANVLAAEFGDVSESALAAAQASSKSWQASASDLETAMATADASVQEGSSNTAQTVAANGSKMESSISSIGGKIQMVGIQLGLLGASIAAPSVEAVKAAGDQVEAFDQLGTTVQNVYTSATTPAAGFATEVADLTAKINAQKATIAEDGAAMQKWTGTTAEVAASHEKAAASVATAQVNIQKLQQQLDELTNSQQLAGGSATDTAAEFEAVAKGATSLGFNVSDSAQALQFLFASTNSGLSNAVGFPRCDGPLGREGYRPHDRQ